MKLLRRAPLTILASIAFACPPAAAQTAPALTETQAQNVERLIERGLEDDLAWEVLESLTTEIGPRLPASPAEARAREWGVAKLKKLGFKNVRIETFEMPYWERISEKAEIISPFPQQLIVTALGNSIGTPAGGITAEVMRFETLPALAAAPMEGFEGKIIFVDELMTRTQDGSGYGVAVAKRSGAAREAGKRGALAALIRSVGTDNHRGPHTGGMNYKEGIAQIPIAALSSPDADQLARAMKLANGPVTVKLDLSVTMKESEVSGNVIGEIPGQTDELIVIGGHLDSWDLGTGAIDDASGIAITMAAAKLIDNLRGKPKRTIRVVMWGAEEVGLYGAKAYAKQHADELDRHVLAAESDFGAGEIYRLDTRFGDGAVAKAAPMAVALRGLGVAPGATDIGGGPDIGPIRDLGVPVVSLRQSGWDYFDLHHTPDDTLDKVDPAALRQNVAVWAAFLYMASEMEGDFGRLPPKEVAE